MSVALFRELEEARAEAQYWRERYEEAVGLRAPPVIDGLSPQQARLVDVLRNARGRVVAYEPLHEAVAMWAHDAASRSVLHDIRAHIKRRRPDLGAKIETVRGIGFRWCEAA